MMGDVNIKNDSEWGMVGENIMLTEQRKLFIDEFLKQRCKNQKKAAIAAGYSEKTAESQASQILKDDKVQEYLQSKKSELERSLREEFVFDALEARKVMHDIMMNPAADARDRLTAARDFLDRAGYKAPEKLVHSGTVTTGPPELMEILEQLKAAPPIEEEGPRDE